MTAQHRSRRAAGILSALGTAFLLAACQPQAGSTEAANGEPLGSGFDFFLLSLSWSPSHCEIQGDAAHPRQCGTGRGLGFVVHGLWPQFENGYPEFCDTAEPARVPDALTDAMVDIMPAGLVGHQWRKHGSCTGLSQADYLAATREAYERVTIPAEFTSARQSRRIEPEQAERAFLDANPGLSADGIAVTCTEGRFAEVRICMTRTLSFRSCQEVDRRGCRAASVSLPAAP